MTTRQEKQNKDYRKMIRELKKDVASMYVRKVQHDSYYQHFRNLKDEVLIELKP